MGLAEYKRKRDFKKTAEPAGKPLPKKIKGASCFVMQKHAARRLMAKKQKANGHLCGFAAAMVKKISG
ncbi:MAG: hypothetical protein DMC60_05370 [Verrucomicrobia bacterium]|nr:MAG: hypothetical protein DMC60_05370 [Verrucomicrobiota bacterium]